MKRNFPFFLYFCNQYARRDKKYDSRGEGRSGKAAFHPAFGRRKDRPFAESISVPVLEQLRIEAARATLSPLVITEDYRFLLPDYGNKEVQLSPIHKALYLLFLNHPEGIEFKNLVDHREELLSLYRKPATESTLKKSQKQCVA